MSKEVTREKMLGLVDEQIRVFDLSEFGVDGTNPIQEGWKAIRALISSRPKVSREFVEKWASNCFNDEWYIDKNAVPWGHDTNGLIRKMLTEAGVEVEKP